MVRGEHYDWFSVLFYYQNRTKLNAVYITQFTEIIKIDKRMLPYNRVIHFSFT